MLRDAAINWIRRNCTSDKFLQKAAGQLDDSIRAGVNCSFDFGPAVIKSRAPYLLYWFAGELFIFQLTRPQASILGVDANAMRFMKDTRPSLPPPLQPPLLALDDLKLEPPAIRRASDPIIARCRYEVIGEVPESYCVRMDFAAGGIANYIVYDHPIAPLEKQGLLKMTFQILDGPNAPNFAGLEKLMVGFVRVCRKPNAGQGNEGQPLSNALATLLEFA